MMTVMVVVPEPRRRQTHTTTYQMLLSWSPGGVIMTPGYSDAFSPGFFLQLLSAR